MNAQVEEETTVMIDGTEYTNTQLNALLKSELIILANNYGVQGVTTANTKAEIIDAIFAHMV